MKVKLCFKGPVFNDTGFGFHGTKASVIQDLDIFGFGSDGSSGIGWFHGFSSVLDWFHGSSSVLDGFLGSGCFLMVFFRIWTGGFHSDQDSHMMVRV
jgi:hypothetical protein